MLGKLFGMKSKKTEEILLAPLSGRAIQLEEVPDPTFAQKMLGDGIAFEPTEGKMFSPVNGKVIQVFPTKHAIGLESETGLEILIHVGLETVNLKGEGFDTKVKPGDKVKAGDLLLTFDLEFIQTNAASIITPCVITNPDKIESLEKQYNEQAVGGQTPVMNIKVKA
jgi:sugar PTS system EIIA component